ncbi:type II toxin-antitoxin system HigB family toxin [Methylomonas sp. MO1]|uniref:type II toxin-antitoxin system HigB family toxin n=1 Tax=Methylomonas sp. MO1 TaxID=3073619 RepID=UPI0028A43890|nr:type II toxin-antitoxin system HigB family toxin [Methylomonas sp. MO1]MDT4288831.1 type II toxin-antitoxin system HigB family toxin [Methylomonas sp. MO1]
MDAPSYSRRIPSNANSISERHALCSVNLGGNKYRPALEMQYRAGIAWIKFVGTHAQYDLIDVETVNDY